MDKYITVDIPSFRDENQGKFGANMHWWIDSQTVRVINHLEKLHPDYEFVQFVFTSDERRSPCEFAIMKLK